MSSLLHEKLQDILQTSIETHQFDRAEQAVSYLRQLARIEAFIARESFQSSAATVSASIQQDSTENTPKDLLFPAAADSISTQNINDHQRKPDALMLYYIEEDNMLKFKKTPQTYAVSVEFFRKFLNNLESLKEEDPFSSKTFYETFANDLQSLTTYQSSTLRQFITLLFRYCYKLDILIKPRPPQRSRFYVNESLNTEGVIEDIIKQKILML